MSDAHKPPLSAQALEAEVASRAVPLWKDNPVRQTIRRGIARELALGRDPELVIATNWARTESLAAGCFKDHPPACASGCAHCCHTRVGLNAVEARTLARALRRLPAAHLQRFRERALENAQRAKGTSANTYPRMRCALLESDDRCGAYEHRPFTCRRGHSFDADMCRRAKEGEAVGMPVDARVIAVYSEVATAFREASAGFGGDPESYELQQSLAILLAEGTDVDSADLTPALELSDGIDDATLAAASATVSAALRGGSQGPNGAPPGG